MLELVDKKCTFTYIIFFTLLTHYCLENIISRVQCLGSRAQGTVTFTAGFLRPRSCVRAPCSVLLRARWPSSSTPRSTWLSAAPSTRRLARSMPCRVPVPPCRCLTVEPGATKAVTVSFAPLTTASCGDGVRGGGKPGEGRGDAGGARRGDGRVGEPAGALARARQNKGKRASVLLLPLINL